MTPLASFNATVGPAEVSTTTGGGMITYTLPTLIKVSVVVQIFLIVIIFIGNLWVITLMVRYRRLWNCSNYFTTSMAVADLLFSVAVTASVKITIDPFFISDADACALFYWPQMYTSTMSMFSLLCVSVDRLVKVVRPLRYNLIVTERKVAYIISGIWIYGVCSIIVPLLGGVRNDNVPCFDFARFFNYYHIHYIFISHAFLPFVTLLGIYGCMFLVVRDKLRTSRRFQPSDSSGSTSVWRRELRSLFTLAIIAGFSGAAWLPQLTLALLDLHFPRVQAPLTIRTVFSWFGHFNSGINPIIYALRSEPFKLASREFVSDLWSLLSSQPLTRSRKVHPGSGPAIVETIN